VQLPASLHNQRRTLLAWTPIQSQVALAARIDPVGAGTPRGVVAEAEAGTRAEVAVEVAAPIEVAAIRGASRVAENGGE
jgi:hypothetical protein